MNSSCFPPLAKLFTKPVHDCDVELQGLTTGSESSAICETAGKLAKQSKIAIATDFLSNLFKAWRNKTKTYDEVIDKCAASKDFCKKFIAKFIQEAEDRQLDHLNVQSNITDYRFFLAFRKPYKSNLKVTLIKEINDCLGKIIFNGRNYLKYPKQYLEKPSKIDPSTKYIATTLDDFLDKTIILDKQETNPGKLIADLSKNNKKSWESICSENETLIHELKILQHGKTDEQKQKAFNNILADIDNFIIDSNPESEKKYAITLTLEGLHATQIYIQKGKIISTNEAFSKEFKILEKLSASPLVKNYNFELYTPPDLFIDPGMLGTFYTCQAMAGSIIQRIAKLTEVGIQPFIFDEEKKQVFPNPIIYSNAQSDQFFEKYVVLYNEKVKELNAKEPDPSKHIKTFDTEDRKAYKDLPAGRTKDNLFYFLFKNLEGEEDIRYIMGKLKQAHPDIMAAVLEDYAQNPTAWEEAAQKPTTTNEQA